VVGTHVFFTPFNHDNVGVLDTTTDTFSTISTVGVGGTDNPKYNGAALVGTRIFFPPFKEDNGRVVSC